MNRPLRGFAFAVAAIGTLAWTHSAGAVTNWFGYGGVFGPQTNYTFYAPQAVSAGYAPQPVTSFSVPAGLGEQVIVSSSPVVPAIAYSPVTTFAPVTSCRPVMAYSVGTCGSTCGTMCGPTTFVAPPAATAPLIVTPPAATVIPTTPTFGTPVYPPPGVYQPSTTVPLPPARTPEMPTSAAPISPADQPPSMSGYAPIQLPPPPTDNPYEGTYTGAAPPAAAAPAAASATPNAAKTEKSDASQAPAIDHLRPDLDISMPADDDEMTPVAPSDSDSKSKLKTDAAPTGETESGPRLNGDEDHTAARGTRQASLLSTATWRAARPAARRAATKPAADGWRPAAK